MSSQSPYCTGGYSFSTRIFSFFICELILNYFSGLTGGLISGPATLEGSGKFTAVCDEALPILLTAESKMKCSTCHVHFLRPYLWELLYAFGSLHDTPP